MTVRMTEDDLNWRVEQACREGWPAAIEAVTDGWLLRRSGGRIRRTNSANPLRIQRGAPDKAIDAAEAFYVGYGQTPLFRVPDIAGELEATLDKRGYQAEGGTIHLYSGIDDMPATETLPFHPRPARIGWRPVFAWKLMTKPTAASFAR